ncbi:MAG: response regulator [Clostridia bacterium]|nr:response regulator [Deltaproteobacteria bacterium]
MKLLIIDDDVTFRTRLARALTEREVSVVQAGSFAEADTALAADTFTHALVDLRLGEEDGVALVRKIRASVSTITIVVLTGYGSIVTAVEAVRAGANDYLTKPADADQILAVLNGEAAPHPDDEHDVPSLARVEYEHLQRVLADCEGNISEAARRLGLHRRSLQRKLGKYPPNR